MKKGNKMTNNSIMPNRLINEKSPYLLQHAHNPVDWFPWGQEAFDKAKLEDKPIFLSIGYSTCHWCHVMASESFEDNEVAKILNKDYISIKVDKEERPDIDAVYMKACQFMTGQGGWPNTIIMTPDQRPFFAATYLPKRTSYGRVGLIEILEKTISAWKNDRNKVDIAADRIVSVLNEEAKLEAAEISDLSDHIISTALSDYETSFDERYGGFGSHPKFPTPHNLLLLMKIYEIYKDERALEMVEITLTQMYRGGIFDHIGGGFSRYSTDRMWLAPHFEKMLYDNALLVIAYTEAYRITEDDLYKKVVTETLDYVMREMTDPDGGFYSSQDADSEGEEGKYYLFSLKEVLQILGEEDGKLFSSFYDITDKGNFEGLSIPNLLKNRDYRKIPEEILAMRNKLFSYRAERVHLSKDDKILTSWNGLMIAAFSLAYRVFRNREYLDAAEKADAFIISKLTKKDGGLRVWYCDRDSGGKGFLEDYSYYIWGLLELYESTYKISYLQRALDINKRMIHDYWDEERSGFYMTTINSEKLIIRPKETYDGAMPSGNSVAAYNMIRLARKLDSKDMMHLFERQISYLCNNADRYPTGYSFALYVLLYHMNI